jgi:hypothetical protein
MLKSIAFVPSAAFAVSGVEADFRYRSGMTGADDDLAGGRGEGPRRWRRPGRASDKGPGDQAPDRPEATVMNLIL